MLYNNQSIARHALPILKAQQIDLQMQRQYSKIHNRKKQSLGELSEHSSKFHSPQRTAYAEAESQKLKSNGSLKSLLDMKVVSRHGGVGKTISNSMGGEQSNMTVRDISHIVDGKSFNTRDAHARKEQLLVKQLAHKSEVAYSRFQDYISSQMKKVNVPMREEPQKFHKLDLEDDTLNQINQILENYSDLSLYETIAKELQQQEGVKSQQMANLQVSLKTQVATGEFVSVPSPKSTSHQQYKEQLQKTNQHFFSNQPAGRVDAVNLKQWLQATLAQIQHNTALDNPTKYQKADEILFLALNELIRQVAYGCLERGQLIYSIFKGYLVLVKKMQTQNAKEHQANQILTYKQELELQNLYSGALKSKDEKIAYHEVELNSKVKEISALKEDLKLAIQAERALGVKLDQNRMMQRQAATMIKNLQRENTDLRGKIEKMRMVQYEDVPRAQPLQPAPPPKQSTTNRTSDLNSNGYSSGEEEGEEALQMLLREAEHKTSVETNKDIIVKDIVDEPPKILYSKEVQTEDIKNSEDAGCQSTLQLIGLEYDRLMQQNEIEDQLKELAIKDQILEFTNLNFIDDQDEKSSALVPQIQVSEPGSQRPASNRHQLTINPTRIHSSRSSKAPEDSRLNLLRIINGLPGNIDQVKNMDKVDMFDMFVKNLDHLRNALDKEEIRNATDLSEDPIYPEQTSQFKIDEPPSNPPTSIPPQPPVFERNPNRKPTRKIQRESSLEIITQEGDGESSPEITKAKLMKQGSSANVLGRLVPKPRMSVQAINLEALRLGNDKKAERNSLTPQQSQSVAQQPQYSTPQPSQQLSPSNASVKPSSFKQSQAEQPKMLNHQTISSKFGLTKGEQVALKTQLTMLIMIHNIQVQKNHNLQKSVSELMEFLREVFSFCHKLLMHIVHTQKTTHRQIIELFMTEFERIRARIPKEYDQEIKPEDLAEEEDEEVVLERKKQQNLKNAVKKTRRITKALEFNFTQKLSKPTIFDKIGHPGVVIALKVRENHQALKKTINFWPLRNILKTITQLYDEKIRFGKDNQVAKDLEMQIFVFNNFLNRFGFKSVAEKKYLQFLCSVIHFNSIFRVNVFARMINLFNEDNINYNQDEVAFYLQGLEYMNRESTLGVNVIHSEGEQKYYVPYLRGLDYMEVHLEDKMTQDELREIRNDLETLKEPDPKNLNKAGLVDADIFLVKVLVKYRIITNRTKEFVIHAFQAADLDGNKKINLNEFLTLFRHIEHEKFHFRKALNIFEESADIITIEEKNLSFDRFTAVCVNQQIFQEGSLNRFINLEKQKKVQDLFNEVKHSWQDYKFEMLKILQELQPYVTPEIHTSWNEILSTLEQRISNNVAVEQMKPILIAHRILKLELQRLVQIGQQEDDMEEFDDPTKKI